MDSPIVYIKTPRLRKLAVYLKGNVLNPFLSGAKVKALEIEKKGVFLCKLGRVNRKTKLQKKS